MYIYIYIPWSNHQPKDEQGFRSDPKLEEHFVTACKHALADCLSALIEAFNKVIGTPCGDWDFRWQNVSKALYANGWIPWDKNVSFDSRI